LIGSTNSAYGNQDVILGYFNYACDYRAAALGTQNTASGYYAAAIGNRNYATACFSTAIGNTNAASAYLATAIGQRNTACGLNSTASGFCNEACGNASVAFGLINTVSGYLGTAFGYSNTVSACRASAFGQCVTNATANSVQIGPSDAAKAQINSAGTFSVRQGQATNTNRANVGGAIFNHFVDVGNATTVETDLYSDTIAASVLGTNGDKLEAEYGGVFVSSASATREVKIYFAGTAIFDTGALTLSLSSAWTAYVTLIRVSATVVRYMISFTTEGAALAAYTSVGEVTGLTLTGTNILKITGQAAGVGAASGDITC